MHDTGYALSVVAGRLFQKYMFSRQQVTGGADGAFFCGSSYRSHPGESRDPDSEM
jgi:hypothetical protein